MSDPQAREPQPFKHNLGPALVAELSRRIAAVYPAFPAAAFVAQVTPQLGPLELKGRVAAIAAGLRDHLPPAYPEAAAILLALLGPPIGAEEGMFEDGWINWPLAAFVERYGLEHLDESLAAMHAITQRHTAEFAIRPFLMRYPAETLAALERWASDPSPHVRRLVSEGTRTRLPWAGRLPAFIADPAPVLALLERLKDDPSPYVRRSVANNLNDLAKDHPELILATLARWSEGADDTRRALIRHALRTLVKQGRPEALALLGAREPQVDLVALEVAPARIAIGQSLTLAVQLQSTAAAPQQLVVDYVLHMPGANGRRRSKVFKLRSQLVGPGERLQLSRRHSFVPVTVRRLYPGPHRIEVQVNGRILGGAEFELVERPAPAAQA